MKYMRILTDGDGNGAIVFTKQEVKLINKNKKLTFDKFTMKDFSNTLVHIAVQLNKNLPPELEKKLTEKNQHLEMK